MILDAIYYIYAILSNPIFHICFSILFYFFFFFVTERYIIPFVFENAVTKFACYTLIQIKKKRKKQARVPF